MRSAFQLVFNSWKIRRTELPTEFVGTLDRSEIIKTNVSSFVSRDAPHHVDFQIPIDPSAARSPFVVLYDVILRRMKTITRSNNNESFKKASATVHVNIPIQIEPLIATQRCRGPKYIHTHLWWVGNRSIAPHLSTSPVLAVAIDINGVPTMVVTIGKEQPVATLNDHHHNHAIISTAERN